MNHLGTACKKIIEGPRQELRLSIALSRNVEFQPENIKAGEEPA